MEKPLHSIEGVNNKNKNFTLIILGSIIIVLIISLLKYYAGPKIFYEGGPSYTHYNNYIIFKASSFHLLEGKNLYQSYPAEHWDLFKYSPSFALFMRFFAMFPDMIGLILWNLLNVLVFVFALKKIALYPRNRVILFAIFLLPELINSVQNSQSNALIAGLLVYAFVFLEKKNIAIASLMIVLSIFIKLFGIVALALFLLYPQKLKAIFWTLGWSILLIILPLIVIPVEQLSNQYHFWLDLLKNDHSGSYGISVAGWLHSWFGLEQKSLIFIMGVVIFLIPLTFFKNYSSALFRLIFLSSILVWIVIFNHKAESPTFIIALTGIGIWYFSQPFNKINTALFILAFIFTALLSTDLFPSDFRTGFAKSHAIKAVPCFLIWMKIIWDLLMIKPGKNDNPAADKGNSGIVTS
jgi:hypothetical protein